MVPCNDNGSRQFLRLFVAHSMLDIKKFLTIIGSESSQISFGCGKVKCIVTTKLRPPPPWFGWLTVWFASWIDELLGARVVWHSLSSVQLFSVNFNNYAVSYMLCCCCSTYICIPLLMHGHTGILTIWLAVIFTLTSFLSINTLLPFHTFIWTEFIYI